MKRIVLLAIVLTISLVIANAQDRLVMNDGTEIKVKVLEIKPDVITYKKYTNLSGPTYESSRSNIQKIIFQNGDQEIITAESNEGEIGVDFTFVANDTVVITRVYPNSPASEMGLREGDRVIQIGTVKVGQFRSEANVNDLFSGPVNSTVNVIFLRGKVKVPITIPVQRALPTWENVSPPPVSNTPPPAEPKVVQTNPAPTENRTSTSDSKNVPTEKEVGGFYISVMPGIGGVAGFNEPGIGVFDFEIGDCFPHSNATVALRTTLYHEFEDDLLLAGIKFTSTGYFGRYTKQGFGIGGEIGVTFFPRGDQALWDFGCNLVYSFRLHKNIRLELVGNMNLLPTISFSNIGFGGYGAARFTGIF